jgi:hypothetical protein
MVEVVPPDGWEWPDATSAALLDEVSADCPPMAEQPTGDTAAATEGAGEAGVSDIGEDRETVDQEVAVPHRTLFWSVMAAAMFVVIVGLAWTLLPSGTPRAPLDDVPPVNGAPLAADVVAQPDIDQLAPKAVEPMQDVPTDPWERFLYDQATVSSLWAAEPFQMLVDVWSHRAVAQLNRAEIERIVYATRMQQLTGALSQYAAANDETFPAGAAGSTLLSVDTRLSWIASILPELGQPAWHDQLRFSRAWNAEGNRDVAARTLAAVVNPGVTGMFTADGAAVTHFVGLAGWGEDAAQLDPADPLAGVFSYNQPRTAAQIRDGLSQTIAIMSVAERLGPWARGGAATVRPLTSEPYINGPDGFGGGSGSRGGKDRNDGMLVGMADGSVRFFAAGTDPRILERLATIAGGPAPAAAAAGVPLAEWLPRDEAAVDDPHGGVAADEQSLSEAESAEWLIATERRLALRVRDVRFTDVTLEDFCSFVARMAGVPVRLTVDVSGGERIGAGDTLSLRLDDATVGDMLSAALATRGLRPVIGPEGIDVFSAEQPSPVVALAYDVAPLARGQSAVAEQIADLVRRFAVGRAAEPTEVARVGIRADGELVVEAPVNEQREVVRLIGALCVLSGVDPPVAFSPPFAFGAPAAASPQKIGLGAEWAAIAQRLARPVSLPAVERVGWADLADVWHDELGLNLVLDAEAVAGSEIPLAWPGSDAVENRPWGGVLDQWLAPLGLAAVWTGEDTIQVTTAARAATREVLAWHRLPEIVGESDNGDSDDGDRAAAQALAAALRASVAPGSWLESGGTGDLFLDPGSGYLLVRQTEPVQRQVQAFLTDWSASSGVAHEGEAENRQ